MCLRLLLHIKRNERRKNVEPINDYCCHKNQRVSRTYSVHPLALFQYCRSYGRHSLPWNLLPLFVFWKLSTIPNHPCGPGWLSHHSNFSRVGESGDTIPVGASCSIPVQASTEVHPAIHKMGNFFFYFPNIRWPKRGFDHSPHLTQRLKKELSYTSPNLLGFHGLF